MTKDEAQRSPSALLRAVSMSNGRCTFYEAVIVNFSIPPVTVFYPTINSLKANMREFCRTFLGEGKKSTFRCLSLKGDFRHEMMVGAQLPAQGSKNRNHKGDRQGMVDMGRYSPMIMPSLLHFL